MECGDVCRPRVEGGILCDHPHLRRLGRLAGLPGRDPREGRTLLRPWVWPAFFSLTVPRPCHVSSEGPLSPTCLSTLLHPDQICIIIDLN